MTRLEKKTEEQRREFERSMKSLEADAERQLQELRQQLFARAAEGEKAAARAKASVDDLQQDLLTRVKEGEANNSMTRVSDYNWGVYTSDFDQPAPETIIKSRRIFVIYWTHMFVKSSKRMRRSPFLKNIKCSGHCRGLI